MRPVIVYSVKSHVMLLEVLRVFESVGGILSFCSLEDKNNTSSLQEDSRDLNIVYHFSYGYINVFLSFPLCWRSPEDCQESYVRVGTALTPNGFVIGGDGIQSVVSRHIYLICRIEQRSLGVISPG